MTIIQKSKPHGIGGWLIPLVGYLGIFRPVTQFLDVSASLTVDVQTKQSLGSIWTTYEFCNWSIAAFGIGGCLFLTHRLLFVRRRSTIRVVALGVWLVAFMPVLLQLALIITLFPSFDLDAKKVEQILLWAGFPLLCSIYMFKSRRVANTYLDEEVGIGKIFG